VIEPERLRERLCLEVSVRLLCKERWAFGVLSTAWISSSEESSESILYDNFVRGQPFGQIDARPTREARDVAIAPVRCKQIIGRLT
jgi:hypothetical protein